ncbi:AMP-binding protein, partial [Candidatus Saccharibacteria bacterium]|nr:AMP-binding protein [Candidatus Saccharibacteria bacterium]NIV73059.1 AMP-binding protein [Calditrichia bacterium]NIW80691.1 AMP-binding protein [Calditrichia bacterium]
MLSENRFEWAFSDYAILSNGAASVPIYATLLASSVKYIINDSDAKIVIISNAEQFNKILEVESEIPAVEKFILIEPEGLDHDKVMSFEQVKEEGEKYLADNPDHIANKLNTLNRDDLATIIYTSGTTGVPKGVMITHGNMLSNIEGGIQAIPVSEEDTFLSFLPLSHVFERMVGHFLANHIGASIGYAESVDTVAENLGEVRPTLMASVPRIFEKIYARVLESVEEGSALKRKLFYWAIEVGRQVAAHRQQNKPLPGGLNFKHKIANKLVFSKLQQRVGGRVRFFVSGGAPLSKEIGEFFAAAGLIIVEGYGLTETSP